jgi:hypothetical protein
LTAVLGAGRAADGGGEQAPRAKDKASIAGGKSRVIFISTQERNVRTSELP